MVVGIDGNVRLDLSPLDRRPASCPSWQLRTGEAPEIVTGVPGRGVAARARRRRPRRTRRRRQMVGAGSLDRLDGADDAVDLGRRVDDARAEAHVLGRVRRDGRDEPARGSASTTARAASRVLKQTRPAESSGERGVRRRTFGSAASSSLQVGRELARSRSATRRFPIARWNCERLGERPAVLEGVKAAGRHRRRLRRVGRRASPWIHAP